MEDLIESEIHSGPSKYVWFGAPRAKSSAELEQRERGYFAYCQTLDGRLPLPFYDADGEMEPLSEIALRQIAELGITVAEYVELIKTRR